MLALWIKLQFSCLWSFCFAFWSLTFFIGVVYSMLTKRATLSPKNPVCKIFNMAFLQDEIKEDKNKSTAEAKSISSCLCIETASYAAHQTASSLICCPLTQKEAHGEKKGVQTYVQSLIIFRGLTQKQVLKSAQGNLLSMPGIGSVRVFLKRAGSSELQVTWMFLTYYLKLVLGVWMLWKDNMWEMRSATQCFVRWTWAVNLCCVSI